MFQKNFVEKIKTHILFSITFSRKSCRLWDNVEKCGRAREATGNWKRLVSFACWITMATDTNRNMQHLSFSHSNNGYTDASQCYVYTQIARLVLNPGSTTPNQGVFRYVSDVKILNLVLSAFPEHLSVLFCSILCTVCAFIPCTLRQAFD